MHKMALIAKASLFLLFGSLLALTVIWVGSSTVFASEFIKPLATSNPTKYLVLLPQGSKAPGPHVCVSNCELKCMKKFSCATLSVSKKLKCNDACEKSCVKRCTKDVGWGVPIPQTCDINRKLSCWGDDLWLAACHADFGGPWCDLAADKMKVQD